MWPSAGILHDRKLQLQRYWAHQVTKLMTYPILHNGVQPSDMYIIYNLRSYNTPFMLGVVFDEDENFNENWTKDTKNRGFRLFYQQNLCESDIEEDLEGSQRCKEPDKMSLQSPSPPTHSNTATTPTHLTTTSQMLRTDINGTLLTSPHCSIDIIPINDNICQV